MKKLFSAILCLILVASMMLTMTGCFGEQSKFVGTWETKLDLTDSLQEELEKDETIGEYIEITDYSFVLSFTFNDDGTYSQSIDEDSVDKAFESLKGDLVDCFEDYFQDYATSLGVTTQDLLVAMEASSVKEVVDEAYTKEMVDGVVDEMLGEVNGEGKYRVFDGKLCLSAGLEYEVDEEQYYTYEITENTLTLLESFVDEEEDIEDLYPMTYNRVK